MKSWPYCQHPECHNPRTWDYWQQRGPVTYNGAWKPDGTLHTSGVPSSPHSVGARRLCHTHALLDLRVAFGGAR